MYRLPPPHPQIAQAKEVVTVVIHNTTAMIIFFIVELDCLNVISNEVRNLFSI